jgi:hypothetical protein
MLKARDNPLRTARLHALRHRPIRWSWDDLRRRLRDFNGRGAIVGPCGSGKTTLLAELTAELRAEGKRMLETLLTDQQQTLPASFLEQIRGDASAIVVVDGAEQLSRSSWNALTTAAKASQGLIITAHQPSLLPTLVECSTDLTLLESLLCTLLDPAQRRILGDAPRSRFEVRRGNLRLVLRDLYDLLAEKG